MNQRRLATHARRKALHAQSLRVTSPSRQDLLHLRVSSVPLGKRFVAGGLGVCCLLGGAIASLEAGTPLIGGILLLLGLPLLALAFFAGRQTIDSALRGIDNATASNLLDAIGDGL